MTAAGRVDSGCGQATDDDLEALSLHSDLLFPSVGAVSVADQVVFTRFYVACSTLTANDVYMHSFRKLYHQTRY